MNSKNTKKFLFILSFLLPIIIMFIVYALLNQWPLGEKSLIVDWDIKEQYSNYFAYLKTVLKGENNFIYSFSKVLGGDFIGLAGYYLLSPFNILFLILDNLKLEIVILIITLLKLGASGLTFNLFISKKFKVSYYNLLFSTSYALMAYNIVYQQNLMWLDGVILLPLVILGIDNIIEDKSFLLYAISLAVAIFSNYYIGYMIGIISIIYFLYAISFKIKIPLKENLKKVLKKSLVFLGYTVISVGSVLFLLLPIFESLEGGKGPNKSNELLLNFKFAFNPIEFLSKLYTGAFSWHEVMDGFPLIFCGWLVTIYFLLFFLNNNFSKEERIKSLFLVIILVLSMQVTAFINVWHGFNLPTGFPARNSFIFSFFMIYFAYKSFLYSQNINLKYLKFAFCVIILASFFIITKFTKFDYISYENYVWSIIAATFFLLIFIIKDLKIKYSIVSGGVATLTFLICFFDLGLNGYLSLSKYSFENINNLENFEKKNAVICDYIKETDQDQFYRIEKNYCRTRNDNMLLNINGVSHYSSCEKHFVKDFLGKLGLDQYGDVYATYGKGGTMLTDALLGIKYILSSYKPNDNYKAVKSFDDITVYKNLNALPLGISASADVTSVDIDTLNRFDIQNKMISSIVGRNVEILKPYKNIISEYENLKVSVKKNVKYFRKSNDKLGAKIKYKFLVEDENPIYVEFITPKTSSAKVKINGKYMNFDFSNINKPILKIGEFKEGEEINIELELLGKRLCMEEVLIYREDINLLNDVFAKIKEKENRFERQSSSHLIGYVNIERNQNNLVFSVPYEKAWNIKVDGKRVDTFRVFDALLGITLPPGTHSIDMEYIPVTFYKGLIASVFFDIVGIYLYIFNRRKYKLKQSA